MKRLSQMLALGGTAAFLLSAPQVQAQADGGGNGGGGRRGGGDPAQRMEAALERYKGALEFTSDDEWNAVKPLVQKVVEARMQNFGGRGFGAFGGGRRAGGPGGDQGGGQAANRGGFGQPSPAVDALQKAIEAKAPAEEIKTKLAAVRKERADSEAALTKAQEDLKKVLSARREAQAVLANLLN